MGRGAMDSVRLLGLRQRVLASCSFFLAGRTMLWCRRPCHRQTLSQDWAVESSSGTVIPAGGLRAVAGIGGQVRPR